MTEDRAVRVTIEGPDPLVRDVVPGSAGSSGSGTQEVLVTRLPASTSQRTTGVRRYEVIVAGWRFVATAEPAELADLRSTATRAAHQAAPLGSQGIRAQIPGRVVRVWVIEGEAVELGQRLLSVEAMKMENEVRAPRGGTVDGVLVTPGQTVELGDELVRLA